MYYAPSDTPAMARTSNLNEELGQVHIAFKLSIYFPRFDNATKIISFMQFFYLQKMTTLNKVYNKLFLLINLR